MKLFKEMAATRGNCTAGGQEEEEAIEQNKRNHKYLLCRGFSKERASVSSFKRLTLKGETLEIIFLTVSWMLLFLCILLYILVWFCLSDLIEQIHINYTYSMCHFYISNSFYT